MVKDVCAEAINVVQCLMGKASHYNPFALCERIGISTITDKALQKDGYLVCSDGLKLIFVSSNIQNQHRREFVVAHEIGHFLMHQEQLYCCSNVSVPLSEKVNSSVISGHSGVWHFAFVILIFCGTVSGLSDIFPS